MENENPPPKSWSIHTRTEITSKYKITSQIGSGAYSTVYSAIRHVDNLHVALKEVHHYPSALREIQSLQTLATSSSPSSLPALSATSSSLVGEEESSNVVRMIEFFWREDEDAVLVLELLRSDLGAVVEEGRKREGGIRVGEAKGWVVQVLAAVEACHRNGIMHRDLKPSNILVSAEGVVKLADFGQARILQEPHFVNYEQTPPLLDQNSPNPPSQQAEIEVPGQDGSANEEDKSFASEFDRETQEGDLSCLATCATSDCERDSFRDSYSYEEEERGVDEENGALTSCVGTRWFRAPELLYGSTNYGLEVDLWSLGCIFAELFSLKPLFPGTSDVDQLGTIFNVMGNITEEVWPGCSQLPDYNIISFSKVENPLGLEACVTNRSPAEIVFLKKLLRFDPANRVSASELLNDEYFKEEPLPVPPHELKVPSSRSAQSEGSSGEWGNYKNMDSDSDFDDFGPMNVSTTDTGGYTIRFS